MAEVVFKRQPSVHAARQAREVMIGAPVTSLHNKLNGLEPATTAGLARFAATESAALFGFAVAVVAFNVLAVAKAALHRARGIELIEQALSSHYLANEIADVTEALIAVLDPEDWAVFQTLSVAAMAAWLLELAGQVNLRRYRTHPRGPKKPPAQTHA